MKNVFIVLLIAALGAAAYFYFAKKKNNSTTNSNELIVGKWRVDTVDVSKSKDSNSIFAALIMIPDSNGQKPALDFLNNGIILDSSSKTVDTSFYEIEKEKELFVWSKADSIKAKWLIQRLDSARLVVQDKDSAVISFLKVGR